MSETFVLDIETSGLSRFKDKILCIGVYNPDYQQCFDSAADFATWLKSRVSQPLFITHNGAFDVGFLRHAGVDIRSNWFGDTKSLASILTPRPESLGLEYLSTTYLNKKSYKLDRTKMESYSSEELSKYCLTDCQYTWELWEFLKKRTDAHFAEKWLFPATKFCADMEYDGVWVDKKGLAAYNKEAVTLRDQILLELNKMCLEAIKHYHELEVIELRKQYREMYEKAKEKTKDQTRCLNRYALLESAAISRLLPFNWNSPKQLVWLLKDYYNLNIENRDSEDSTAEAVLRSLDHPVPKKLCDYRETEKLVSTCIPALQENMDENGFVHTHYHIGGTRTGRLSSSGPNLQQIPRGKLRSYVQASGDARVLATIDYSQIEVRIIAEVAKEKELINAFKEGIDPYSVIAKKLLKIDAPVKEIKSKFKKERDVSKTAGLSILYGTGAFKLQEVLKKDLGRDYSVGECKKFIEDYRNSLPGVRAFKQTLECNLANKKVYKNLLGRPFTIDSNEDLYMKSLNTLVQGSASDLVMYSALKVADKLKTLNVDANCRLLIHDEQVWELPADEAELLVTEVIIPAMTTEIQQELGFSVPLAVEYEISREWSKP